MKITIPPDALRLCLERVTPACGGKSSLPAQQAVLIEAGTHGVSFICDSLVCRIETLVELGGNTTGTTLVALSQLHHVIQRCSEPVVLESASAGLKVESGETKAVLPALDATLFPEWKVDDNPSAIEAIDGVKLAAQLSFCCKFCGSANIREFYESAILVSDAAGFTIYCTDGKRFGVGSMPPAKEHFKFEVSAKLLDSVTSLLGIGDIELALMGNSVRFQCEETTVYLRLSQPSAPDFNGLLAGWEKEFKTGGKSVINREALLDAIRDSGAVMAPTDYGVDVAFAPEAVTVSFKSKTGPASFNRPIKATGGPLANAVVVNRAEMEQCLRLLDEDEVVILHAPDSRVMKIYSGDSCWYSALIRPEAP